jgi:hypothetical protein
LLPIALLLNALSLTVLTNVNDRALFKVLSILALIFIFILRFKNLKILKIDLIFLPIPLFYFSLFFSDIINNGVDSLNSLIRAIVNVIFLILILNFSVNELKLAIQNCLKLFLVVAIIGIIFIISGISAAEKIPFINIYSTKSIIFEQNIYGICMFFLFMGYGVFIKSNALLQVTALLGIFSSYYRTIFILASVKIFLSKYFYILLLIFLYIFLNFNEEISAILKIEQLSNLTGRDILWQIGYDGFSTSPLIGLGESSIPSYSNEVLNRDPAYTTYHNVIIDLLYSGGVVSTLLYFSILFIFFIKITNISSIIFISFLLAPSLANTYFIFSFNILGGFVGLVMLYVYRLKTKNA